jgi:hypothetical protein
VSSATGLARQTIHNGRKELEQGVEVDGRIRRPGAGRPGIEETQPGVTVALEKLVEPLTRGDRMSALRWTCKSRANLTAELVRTGWCCRAAQSPVLRPISRKLLDAFAPLAHHESGTGSPRWLM